MLFMWKQSVPLFYFSDDSPRSYNTEAFIPLFYIKMEKKNIGKRKSKEKNASPFLA